MSAIEGLDPDAEIKGSLLLDLRSALGDCGQQIFQSYHLADVHRAHWYPQKIMLEILQAASEYDEAWGINLVLVGMKLAEMEVASKMPPRSRSLCTVLYMMSKIYDETHRGAHPGKMRLVIADPHLDMIAQTAYPCDFDYGLIHQLVHSCQGSAIIAHDHTTPCRKRGSDVCLYRVLL